MRPGTTRAIGAGTAAPAGMAAMTLRVARAPDVAGRNDY